jgi:hypothetical protein
MGNRPSFRAASAFVLIVAGLGAAFGACTQYKSANGEGCLKDEDCLAGSCISGTCEEQSSAGTTSEDAATAAEDAADSATDASAPVDAAIDTNVSTPIDAGTDSGGNATDASNDTSAAPDTSDDADVNDGATGAREIEVLSLTA